MTQGTGNSSSSSSSSSSGGGGQKVESIVNFNEIREQRLEEKRRVTERIFFKSLLSVYTVISQGKMQPIELIDVSDEGCSFQVPFDPERIWPTQTNEFPIRMYFSQDTYLEILVRVQNSRPAIESNARFVRYGCVIDRSLKSYPAYQAFVKFLRQYSEHAHRDKGDISVFYL